VVIGAAHTAPACPSTNDQSLSFPKRKGINLCIKPAHTFTFGLRLSNFHVTWILTAPNPAVEPVYNSIDMERHLFREAHLVVEIG
jgi:hypothetical protein